MNKFTLSFIASFFISAIALAQYNSPNTGVTLSLADIAAESPSTISVDGDEYTIYEDITISENDALVIDTDLIARLDEDVLITIFGSFSVEGEEVLFTALDIEKPFAGFRYEQGSEIFLSNATFEYGGGMRVLTEDFHVEWCVFMDIVGGGATTSAVLQFSRGKPVIKHNLIGHNYLPAIGSAANTSVSAYIFDNMILDNNLDNSNRPQINMGTTYADTPLQIIDNMIIGNETADKVGGIAVANMVGGNLYAEITGNIVADNRYGITVIGANDSVVISNNIIEDNNNETNPMQGGSGIALTSTGVNSPIEIFENEIRGNLWGITVYESRANLGDDENNPGGNIFGENGNGGEVYALYNNSSYEIMAKHNCWIEGHEATPEDVENVIYHKVDDPELGEVIFDPFDCGVLSIEDLEIEGFVVYPNPTNGAIHFTNTHSFDTVHIFGIQGNLIMSKEVMADMNSMQINLPAGIYLMKFSGANGAITKKIIVE